MSGAKSKYKFWLSTLSMQLDEVEWLKIYIQKPKF